MHTSSEVEIVIPTAYPKQHIESKLSKYKNWFYEFVFSGGISTNAPDTLTATIHKSRAELIFPFLDMFFYRRWNEVRCLDIACHQGWFSIQVALRRAREVLGLDVRNNHIKMANTIKDLGDISNVKFKQENLYNIRTEEYGKNELTFFLGILYHLDSPIEALRVAKSVTTQLCVIETQVVRTAPELEYLWGSDTSLRKGPGIAVVMSDENHVEGERSTVFVPTIDALYRMLYSVGFDRVYLSVPPPSVYEQYRDYDRVVVFAQVL